ncbi:hypothetical protein A6A25_32240 [Saccharothrix sp. CB00851]|nr:hypothetical protein A6A25_32240 [Saccharothrix sp. CB00851]
MDVVFAEYLAHGLEAAGFEVFLHSWDVHAGQSKTHRVDQAIQEAESAIIVVSKRAPRDGRVTDEYAALAGRAAAGRLERLVPVLRDDEVVLPPLLEAWAGFSFARVVDQRSFDELVAELVAELRSVRRNRPVDLSLVVPADRARVPHTPLLTTLRITGSTTTLVTGVAEDRSAPNLGMTQQLAHQLWAAEQARTSTGRTFRSDVRPRPATAAVDQVTAVGRALTAAFLPRSIAVALAARIEESASSGRAAHIALEVDQELANLPWEGLVLDGEPLALRPSVRLYRHTAGLGPTALPQVPGPLRILAVIAGPDEGGGELLDYEHELSRILDQVDRARREQAYVRILNWGSVDAIRQALTEESFHVLHISCHARSGVLVLETADGRVDEVTADRLTAELVIPGRLVPLVVLAGCATSQATDELPGLADSLIRRGVPAVLAMTASVTDEYATEFLSRVYGELASQEDPDVLVAMSSVRRRLEADRAADPDHHLPEWSVPALHLRVWHSRLFGRGLADDVVPRVRGPLAGGITDLEIGDFVGRRVDLRKLLRELRAGSGALIHGMGGVGKSSLAAELVHLLGQEERVLVAALHGVCTPDEIVDTVRVTVKAHFGVRAVPELELLRDASETWRTKIEILGRILPGVRARLVLMLDDPLGDPLEADGRPDADPQQLQEFLDTWLELRGRVNLVVTSRMTIPTRSRRIVAHHLGPLSEAETRKLIFRLPALDSLPAEARLRAHHALGGHPRALEYLDALLRGGATREQRRGKGRHFPDVVERIERALLLAGKGATDEWWPAGGRDLDRALAETVSIISSDVLLDELYAEVSRSFPLAAELFVAASVFRQPVEHQALAWIVAPEPEPDPRRQARLSEVYAELAEAERTGSARSRSELPLDGETHAQVNRDLGALVVPAERDGLAAARDRLVGLTLLTPVEDRYLVHRWTARAMATRADPTSLLIAHRRAAAYHRWQADLWKADPFVRLTHLEEARHHSWRAEEDDQALAVSAEMCAVLDRIGALEREWSLCTETLDLAGHDHTRARVFHHRMSVIALRRGDYALAEAEQDTAQRVAIESGDLVAVATGLQQLGTIARLRGETAAAENAYRSAIAVAGDARIGARLDARIVLAGCYQLLGEVALARADTDTAARMSLGAHSVAVEIGDETDSMTIHRDLAELARACGDHVAAARHDLRAQEVAAADVDMGRLIAAAELQLGQVRVEQREFEEAQEHVAAALGFALEMDDVPLLMRCTLLLGYQHVMSRELEDARAAYENVIQFAAEIEDRRAEAYAHQQLGLIWGDLGDLDSARESLRLATAMDPMLAESCRLTLGAVLTDAGRTDEARRVLVEGLATAGDDLAHGFVSQLAQVCLHHDDLDGAWTMFEEGVRRANAAHSRRGSGVCLLGLGLIAQAKGRSKEAVRLFHDALDVVEGDPFVQAMCLVRLADVALGEGEVGDAAEWNAESRELLEGISAPELRAEALRQHGQCLAAVGRYREAAPVLNDAANAFTRLGQRTDVLSCLVTMCWVLDVSGAAASVVETAARLGRAAADQPPSPWVVAARLVAGDGALRRGWPDDALEHYEEARRLAQRCGALSLLVDCEGRLAALARRSGDDARAVRRLEAGLAVARHRSDWLMAMHLYRELGLVTGDRRHIAESAVLAHELRQPVAYRAADGLLDDPSDPARVGDLLAAASAELTDLLWLRRRRAAAGEAAFGDKPATRVGPTIKEIVRGLVSRPSGVAVVSAVVSPSAR